MNTKHWSMCMRESSGKARAIVREFEFGVKWKRFGRHTSPSLLDRFLHTADCLFCGELWENGCLSSAGRLSTMWLYLAAENLVAIFLKIPFE